MHMQKLDLDRDLQRCASHEAGHAFIVELLTKTPAHVVIQQVGPDKYSGTTYYRTPRSVEHRALCAFAGGVAETLDSHLRHSDRASQLAEALWRISWGDRVNAGVFEIAYVQMALKLCASQWEQIVSRAEKEMERVQRRRDLVAGHGGSFS